MLVKNVTRLTWMLTVSAGLLCAESSVYGFGSDDSGDSQSSSEGSSSGSVASLKQQIAEQNERIDGLTTVIEGLTVTVNELQMAKSEVPSGGSGANNDALLKKLAGMIDEINQNYVSKQEFQSGLSSKKSTVTAKENPITVSKNTVETTQESSVENETPATLYNDGVKHFVKKQYAEAKKRFTLTDSKGYKPAASNYYLGEVAYYTNKYEDAIFYFKKSAGLYDQASYIDTLLLHTAISLEKTGDKGQAKVFYQNIVDNYAGKKSADIAKQKLSKLK